MDWEAIVLEEGDTTRTPCDCCRTTTTEAMGNLLSDGTYFAWYTARWSEAHPEHHLLVTVYTGDWSEGAPASARWGTRTEVRFGPESGCALLDWEPEQRATINSFTPLGRDDVLGSDYAKEFWACVDAILMKDPRLEPLVS